MLLIPSLNYSYYSLYKNNYSNIDISRSSFSGIPPLSYFENWREKFISYLGRGFMAAVTSIFRGSPSPITSPDSSKDSPGIQLSHAFV